MSRDVNITYLPKGGDHLEIIKPGAIGGSGDHYWELREHLNNRGFVDWNYWLGLPTWTAFEAGCLADAVDPNKFEPDSDKDQSGRCGLHRRDDLADTVFVSGTEANKHVGNLIRLCERTKAAANPAEWAAFLADHYTQNLIKGEHLSLPTAWVGLVANVSENESELAPEMMSDSYVAASDSDIGSLPQWECTDTLSKNAITGGRHEESIRHCHLISATEASEILAKIFPDTTRKYWVCVIQKEPKWLSKDINNQFGGMRWFVKANGGAGGSGYGPTFVYLPIMLVRFIQYSKNADEAQSKLDKIKQLNIKPLSEKLAFPTIEQCATWTIKNRLSRSI